MTFFGRTYKFAQESNREEFLKSLDVPEEASNFIFDTRPDVRIDQDGDNYKLVLSTSKGQREFDFQPGEEFDTVLGPITLKQTITIEGNIVTSEMRTESGNTTITVIKEFDDDEMFETYSTNKWDGTAKIMYIEKDE